MGLEDLFRPPKRHRTAPLVKAELAHLYARGHLIAFDVTEPDAPPPDAEYFDKVSVALQRARLDDSLKRLGIDVKPIVEILARALCAITAQRTVAPARRQVRFKVQTGRGRPRKYFEAYAVWECRRQIMSVTGKPHFGLIAAMVYVVGVIETTCPLERRYTGPEHEYAGPDSKRGMWAIAWCRKATGGRCDKSPVRCSKATSIARELYRTWQADAD
jgi:hypothetical protein